MNNLSQQASMQQGCKSSTINASDLSYDLDNVLSLIEQIGGEEALSSLSMLIEECRRDSGVSCDYIGNIAQDFLCFYSNVLLVKNCLQDIYNRFCKEGGNQ